MEAGRGSGKRMTIVFRPEAYEWDACQSLGLQDHLAPRVQSDPQGGGWGNITRASGHIKMIYN